MKTTYLWNKALTAMVIFAVLFLATSCSEKYSIEEKEGSNLVVNKGGRILVFSPESGIDILEDKGYAFKDLNRNGTLDKYEDWRLSFKERAQNLASQMTVEQIAGLMLYSAHQGIPSREMGPFGGGTYNGKLFNDSGALSSDLSDQ